MTNKPANRPSTARKRTPKDEAAREEALDQGIRLTLDEGKTWHVLRVGDVTPEIARELRANTGHGFMQLVGMLTGSPDVDLVQEAVWLARRIQGEDIELSDVAFDYQTLFSKAFDIEAPGASADEVDDSPEG